MEQALKSIYLRMIELKTDIELETFNNLIKSSDSQEDLEDVLKTFHRAKFVATKEQLTEYHLLRNSLGFINTYNIVLKPSKTK